MSGLMQRDTKMYSYSITLSAQVSGVAGTARPSNLAVLRLITSSNLRKVWHLSKCDRPVGTPLRIFLIQSIYEAAVSLCVAHSALF
jgi:hypothetical protein